MTQTTTVPFTSIHLDTAEAALQTQGIAFTREAAAIRCELPTGSTVLIVSAENVFAAGRSRNEITDAAWLVGDTLFSEQSKIVPHLVLVGDAATFSYPGHRVHRECVETDRYSPIKRVMLVEELSSFFRPLFYSRHIRANNAPKLTILRYLQYGSSRLSSATHVFDREDELEQFRQCPFGRLTVDEQSVASRIYRKIMGSAYFIIWDQSGPELARLGDAQGIPQYLSSAGEQTALAFSVYLARLANQVVPGMCLGLHNFFNGMDDLKRFDALGCVGEFIEGTGASVLVQSEKQETRQLTKVALNPYVTKLNLLVVEQASEVKATA